MGQPFTTAAHVKSFVEHVTYIRGLDRSWPPWRSASPLGRTARVPGGLTAKLPDS